MIRKAEVKDIPTIRKLLRQVNEVHCQGRPDLFKQNSYKYTESQLKELLKDETRPVFVLCNEEDIPLGYAFCILQDHRSDEMLTDIQTLYIDDICVDENARHQKIGARLYEHVKDYARSIGCYNVTLNVWQCNPAAKSFYEALGMKPQKYGMEEIL